jgi:hypothetical protein
MALNDIKFEKQNGGMGRTSANDDVNSGLIMSMNGKMGAAALSAFDVVGEGDNALYIATLAYYEQLELQYGISREDPPADGSGSGDLYSGNAVDYHAAEFFRMSPTGKLWLAVRLTGEVTGDDIKKLQYYANGALRQAGVFTATLANIADYQKACAGVGLEREHQPLSVVVAPAKGTLELSDFTSANHVLKDRCNVSVLVSCDLAPAVIADLGESHFAYYGCIGNCLGAVSKAAVNESIAWVRKFPLGLNVPGFITGELLKEVSATEQNLINDNQYIFVRTHVGDAGNYYNDSFTLDVATSDYAFIENVRTMDKATRGIRTNLLPRLNAPLYVDASSGKLRADTVKSLENTASRALEDMEKAGELSGYAAEIDPGQNILAASQLEIQVKNVAVGVMRKVLVKIGYTTQTQGG